MTDRAIAPAVEPGDWSPPPMRPAPGDRPPGTGEPRWWRHPDLPAVGLGLVLAIGVCWPLPGGGRTFLLDWVVGPHTPILSDSFYGLNGGLTTGTPLAVVMGAASYLVGPAATWIPIALFFPVATTGMSRLVGGSLWARLGAATLFAVNPFVFQRLFAGQIALLLGYALLPFVVRSMLRAVDARGVARLTPVLWMALVTAMSPHFAWITAIILLAVVVCHRRHLAALAWAVVVGLCFVASLAYVFLPPTGTVLPVTAASSALRAFQTSGDPQVGLFGNVAGLYGFWRLGPGPVLPKNVASGWLFFLAAILVVAVVGVIGTFRGEGALSDPRRGESPPRQEPVIAGLDRRAVVGVAVVSALLGFFLALGSQGPTGPLFQWLFEHMPFFDIMREPEKFSTLLALGYATCFGVGVERLVSGATRHRRLLGHVGAVALAVGLPLAYTPTIFDGLDGQITASQLPVSWNRVQSITGGRTGELLFLPWHEYLSFPFTNDRAIANPAPSSFTGGVISGTDPQVEGLPATPSPSSAYIERVLDDDGSAGPTGTLMAPLGVQYIALAKTVDWRSYLWLANQPTLRLVFDSPSLELWENLAFAGIGHRGVSPVVRLSPVAYRIPAGKPGSVSVAIPYEPGWSLNGVSGRPTGQGTVTVRADRAGGVLRFEPWHLVVAGDLISLAIVGGLAVFCTVDRRRSTGAAAGERHDP